MKNIRAFKFVNLALISIVIYGCATDSSSRNEGHASQSTQAPAPASAHAKSVPQLKVVINCGSCTVAETVPGLVMQGYQNAAKKAGKSVDDAGTATLTITEYSQRPPAARALFGAFAGKDKIAAQVEYKDQKFIVSDYYANAWQGMNALSERIGEMAFEKLSR